MAGEFDVIVIGVGAMGSSACYQLASRGARVLGVDRFGIPNSMGSSHGLSRMIRSAYYEHPNYVPLLRRAFDLWRALQANSPLPLFHEIGGLYMGRETDPAIAGSLTSARIHHLPHEFLTRDELAQRFPQFAVPQDHVALFEQQAGLLRPERSIAAYAKLAREAGAVFRENEEVLEWSSDSTGASVITPGGTWRADHLIFTAGAWTEKLVRNLGVNLTVTRQPLVWLRAVRPARLMLGELPAWAIAHADGSLHYGFPILDDGEGFKVALHKPGRVTDPDRLERTASPEDEAEIRDCVRRFIPDADGPVASIRICMYTNSPDHHFIIDRHPAHDRVTIACGFSGHGFKFASVVGEILADMATQGRTTFPAGFLELKRFGRIT